jgi:hypothetical protein
LHQPLDLSVGQVCEQSAGRFQVQVTTRRGLSEALDSQIAADRVRIAARHHAGNILAAAGFIPSEYPKIRG